MGHEPFDGRDTVVYEFLQIHCCRWLIVLIVNLPIVMFLASIYVFHYIYYWGVPPSRPSPNYLPSEEEANHLALFRWFPEVCGHLILFLSLNSFGTRLLGSASWIPLALL